MCRPVTQATSTLTTYLFRVAGLTSGMREGTPFVSPGHLAHFSGVTTSELLSLPPCHCSSLRFHTLGPASLS